MSTSTVVAGWHLDTSATSLSARERVLVPGAGAFEGVASLANSHLWSARVEGREATIWLTERLRPLVMRVHELSARESGWDSYDGAPLQWPVVPPAFELLMRLDEVISCQPAVSLTAEGGLELRWQNSVALVEIVVQPDKPDLPEVYVQGASGSEWEGLVSDCPALDKWIWQASQPG